MDDRRDRPGTPNRPIHSVVSASVEQTHQIGMRLGASLVGGLTLALMGPLGAGKTHLVKGVAEGNGERDARKVTSPTFTLIQEYTGRLTLFHIDAYRLRGPTELLALGFDELVRPDSVVIVEWADKVRPALPAELLSVDIQSNAATSRTFAFHADGDLAKACLDRFRAAAS